jgi:glutathione synthase/RimK-type ligase-like ATP-grasp enzyme
MIVITEASPQLLPSASANDLQKSTQTADLLGIRTYSIPQNFNEVSIEDVLAHLPVFNVRETAFWVGYVPHPSRYQELYKVLADKNIFLINTPDQFQRAEEFDKYYPLVADLTCKSFVAESLEEARMVARKLGFPVFLKGTVQSFKKWGWKSCVAANETDLGTLFQNLQKHTARSLGKVIVRELVNLKYQRKTGSGFPQGREYRVFILSGDVLSYSYYWDQSDPLSKVLPAEEKIITDLAQQAAQRIGVPYIAIDIGQKTDGEWLVIEAGDAQFSGLCHISPIRLWQEIRKRQEK